MLIALDELEPHIATLRITPAILTAAAARVPDDAARRPLNPDAWSLHQQLTHLLACAELWGGHIERMLTQDRPRFGSPHPRAVMREQRLVSSPFADAAAAFAALRSDLLTRLAPLTPAQWQREAVIDGRVHTVATHVRRMAKHEAAHVDRIRALTPKGEPCR
jgi:hypothetical protein